MSMSPSATDHHQPACDALERSTPVLVEAIRRAPAEVRPRRMRWTNAEIAAHMYATVVESHKLARGVPSAYDGAGPSAELDERLVAGVEERDVSLLAEMVDKATTAFLGDLRALSGGDPVAMPRAQVSTLVALLAAGHHLHGGQFAETAGAAWGGDPADLHAPVSMLLPYSFDPDAARGFTASYTLRVPRDVKLVLWSGSGDVTVSGTTADVDLTSEHGSIDAARLGSEYARASTEHGHVRLRFAAAPMQVQASATHGDVTVVVPRTGESYHVDVSSDHGSTDTAVRTDPTGRRTIDLASEHGDVTVRYPSR